MRVAHILRKYIPSEWGGTETAVKQLMDGLRGYSVDSVVYAPRFDRPVDGDPLSKAGYSVRRFRSFLPVSRLSIGQKRQLISVGGNLMSLDLPFRLWREPDLSLIHCHTLNRLGGIAVAVARGRRCPLVVTIHGGVLDLPAAVKAQLIAPLRGGFEWGKIFGWILRSRRVLERADAIVTCNRQEARLLKEKFPGKCIVVQPHAVPVELFQKNCRASAMAAFPVLAGKTVLLAAGRIDSVKNQAWLVQQLPDIIQRHPKAMLVLAGSATDEIYGKTLAGEIQRLGLETRVLMTGGLAPDDPRWIGLFQTAAVLVLPSLSETFGLVVLEAWASGRAVISTRTSGASELVRDGENGWLFDLNAPEQFHAAMDTALRHPELTARLARNGFEYVTRHHEPHELAGRIHRLYACLIEKKSQ